MDLNKENTENFKPDEVAHKSLLAERNKKRAKGLEDINVRLQNQWENEGDCERAKLLQCRMELNRFKIKDLS